MNKILHVSKYYYPYVGGIEDVCYNIVKFLKSQDNVEQMVFCFNDKDQTIEDKYDGVDIKRVAIKKVVASQPISFCYKSELKKTILQFNPNVIHFHVPNPLVAYYLLKVLPEQTKLIVHWHSDIVAQKLIYSFIKPIETKLLRRANTILATSPNYIEHSKPLAPYKDKVEVLQNIIEPSKFLLNEKVIEQITQIKARYNNKPIVLFVGRHVPYKGLAYLIQAAKEVNSDCQILIGGGGVLTEELKRDALELQYIEFLGRIDEDMLAAYYHAADIFAFPSITKNEAFGVVLAEAMYCSTPAITFTIEGSGVNWVSVNGETGIECENGDSLAFAKAIDKLLTDSSLRDKLGCNAKKRIEELFVINEVGSKIVKLL